ncbi:MAG: hypothetical protein NVS3B24_01650 [Candidatus Dormibacteria bacterium]
MTSLIQPLRLTAAVASVLALAGCGSAGPAATSTGVGSPAAQPAAASSTPAPVQRARSDAEKAAAYKSVCALFTRDEAQATVGDQLALAPSPAPLADLSAGSVPAIGDAAACEYWSVPPAMPDAPAEVTQGIHGFPAIYVAVDTRLVGWQLIQANDKKESLQGLGDEAYYVPPLLAGDTAGGYLAAKKGSKYLFITRTSNAAEVPDVRSRLIKLAQSIMAKI